MAITVGRRLPPRLPPDLHAILVMLLLLLLNLRLHLLLLWLPHLLLLHHVLLLLHLLLLHLLPVALCWRLAGQRLGRRPRRRVLRAPRHDLRLLQGLQQPDSIHPALAAQLAQEGEGLVEGQAYGSPAECLLQATTQRSGM